MDFKGALVCSGWTQRTESLGQGLINGVDEDTTSGRKARVLSYRPGGAVLEAAQKEAVTVETLSQGPGPLDTRNSRTENDPCDRSRAFHNDSGVAMESTTSISYHRLYEQRDFYANKATTEMRHFLFESLQNRMDACKTR